MGKGKARPRRKAHVRAWYGGTSELASPLVSLGSTKGACARTGRARSPAARMRRRARRHHPRGIRPRGCNLGRSPTRRRSRRPWTWRQRHARAGAESSEARAPEQHAHARVPARCSRRPLGPYSPPRRGAPREQRGRGGSDHCGAEPTHCGCALELCNGRAVAPRMKKRRKQVVTPNDETLDGGGVKPITRWKASRDDPERR